MCVCCCVVVVHVCVGVCGCWRSLSLLFSLLPLLFPFLFLSYLSFSLLSFFFSLIFLFLSYLSLSFSLAPSLTLALALVLSLSLLPSFFPYSLFSSLLPPPSLPHPEKREGTFYYRNISGEEFIFYYSFKLIPKTRRRGKLQTLQFYIKSKTINLQRVKSVIIFGEMVIF